MIPCDHMLFLQDVVPLPTTEVLPGPGVGTLKLMRSHLCFLWDRAGSALGVELGGVVIHLRPPPEMGSQVKSK